MEDKKIDVISFALHPENHIPTGTVSFSRINHDKLELSKESLKNANNDVNKYNDINKDNDIQYHKNYAALFAMMNIINKEAKVEADKVSCGEGCYGAKKNIQKQLIKYWMMMIMNLKIELIFKNI